MLLKLIFREVFIEEDLKLLNKEELVEIYNLLIGFDEALAEVDEEIKVNNYEK